MAGLYNAVICYGMLYLLEGNMALGFKNEDFRSVEVQ